MTDDGKRLAFGPGPRRFVITPTGGMSLPDEPIALVEGEMVVMVPCDDPSCTRPNRDGVRHTHHAEKVADK